MNKLPNYLILFLFFAISIPSIGQSNYFNYQGVARDVNNNPIVSELLGFRVSVLNQNNGVVYSETHTVFSSELGVFVLQIGSGTTTMDFNSVDWSQNLSLKTELDINGGNNYVDMGNQPINAVPLALQSLTSGPAGPIGPIGPAGPEGIQGPTGPKGEKGDQGDKGETGNPGPQGNTGQTGPAGSTGPAGNPGPIGQTGATGQPGPAGQPGPTGEPGPAGQPGPAGEMGATGQTGPAGQPGPIGPMGPIGLTGPAGPPGTGGSGVWVQNSGYVSYSGIGAEIDNGVDQAHLEVDNLHFHGIGEDFAFYSREGITHTWPGGQYELNRTSNGLKIANGIDGTTTYGVTKIDFGGLNNGFEISNSNAKLFINGTNGRVGIGNSAPQAALQVSGSIKVGNNLGNLFTEAGGFRVSLDGGLHSTEDGFDPLGTSSKRWSEVFATNGMINTSDARLKRDVKSLNYGLAEILNLKPVSFKWKEVSTTDNNLGFLAQDLLEVIPEVVVTHENLRTKNGFEKIPVENLGVRYNQLIPILTHAIQEQQTMIDKSKQEIISLEKRVSAQDQLIQDLLTRIEN